MIITRSILFNVLFYLNLLVHMLAAMPTLLMPRWGVIAIAKSWGRTSLWLLRIVCRIEVEWRGLERIPEGGLLVAAKHQSTWETFALLPLFRDPIFILKRELMWIPLFGWCTWKGGMIPVDRGGGKPALAAMVARARAALLDRRQIIIFPEGTRRPPGAEPKYKYGIAHIYGEGVAPCLPIALNSGLFWRRRRFLRYPGTVTVEILEPIPPGLDKDAFFGRLQRDLEAATTQLLDDGSRQRRKTEASDFAAV